MSTNTIRFFDDNEVLSVELTPSLENQLIRGLILNDKPGLLIEELRCDNGEPHLATGSFQQRANCVLEYIRNSEQSFNEKYDSWEGGLLLFTNEKHETNFCYHLTKRKVKGARLEEVAKLLKARVPIEIVTTSLNIFRFEKLTGSFEERVEKLILLREQNLEEYKKTNRIVLHESFVLSDTSNENETHGIHTVTNARVVSSKLFKIAEDLNSFRKDLVPRIIIDKNIEWHSFTGTIQDRVDAILKEVEEAEAPYKARNTRPSASGIVLSDTSTDDVTQARYIIYNGTDAENSQ